jgi:hypothetical protein
VSCTRSHRLCANAPHAPGVPPRPRAYWRVRCTRPCSQHTLARALHAPGAPHHYPAATCLSESRHVSPSSATCQASQKKKKKRSGSNIFGPIQRVRTRSSQVGQTFNWSKGFGLLGPFKPAHSNQFKDPKPFIRSSGLDPDPPIWQSYPSTRPIRSYFGSNP